MSWKDAPLAEESTSSWMSAPLANGPRSKRKPQGPVYRDHEYSAKEAAGVGVINTLKNFGEATAGRLFESVDPNWANDTEDKSLQDWNQHYQKVKEDRPFMTGAGEAGPFMTIPFGGLSATLGAPLKGLGGLMRKAPLGMPGEGAISATGRGLAGAGERAAASPLLDTALMGGVEAGVTDRNPGLGMLEAGASHMLTKGLITPFERRPSFLTPKAKRTAKRAQRHGYKLTPGEKTGNITLRQMDNSLRKYPHSAPLFEGVARHNKELATKAVIKAMGGDVDDISLGAGRVESLLAQRGKNIGNVVGKTNIEFTGDDLVKLIDLEDKFRASPQYRGSPALANEFTGWIDEIGKFIKHAQGKDVMKGKDYSKLHHEIWRRTETLNRMTLTIDPKMAKDLSEVNKILDDVFKRNVGQEKWDQLQKLRQMYAIGKMVENKSIVDEATNLVDPAKLGNELGKLNYSKQHIPDVLKDAYLAGDFGLFQKSMGANTGTLAMTDFVGRMMRGGKSSKSAMNTTLEAMTLMGQVPLAGGLIGKTYMSGYPLATGALPILPANTSSLLGSLAGRYTPVTDQAIPIKQGAQNAWDKVKGTVGSIPEEAQGLLRGMFR